MWYNIFMEQQIQKITQKPQSAGRFSFIKKFIGYIKAHKIIAGIVIGVLVLVGFLVYRRVTAPKVSYVTEKAQIMNLKQTVSATGKVDSEEAVDLKFNAAGDIAKIYVASDDQVTAGQLLAELKHSSLDNQIKEAEAAVSLQKANLLKVVQGAKAEEVLVALRKVDSAQAAYNASIIDSQSLQGKLQADLNTLQTQLNNSKQALVDTKASTELTIDNARTNLLISINQGIIKSINSQHQIQVIFDDTDLAATFGATDSQAKNESRSTYDAIASSVAIAQRDYNLANSTQTLADIRTAVNSGTSLLTKVEAMLKAMAQALNATLSNSNFTPAELEAYKSSVRAEQDINNAQKVDLQIKSQAWETALSNQPISLNSAQSNVDSAKATLDAAVANNQVQLTTAKSNIDSAKTSLDLAKAELALTSAKASTSDIAIAQAQVDQSQSALDNLKSQLANYQITAPFAGVAAKVNFKENESVSSQDVVISLIGQQQFKITVDIPESDITKIAVANKADITLDAYGSDQHFSGSVTKIEPGETIIQDVVYYKVDVEIDQTTLEVKKGMSANLDILTNEKKNVVVVPVRAVLDNPDGTKYVRILKDGQVLKSLVTTGLRGDEGKIEIVSGVLNGDEVITFEKQL